MWQVARELARGVYRAADTQPLGKDYALLNQIKRSAVSITSNIAEGYERGTRKQQIEFCYIAKGSAVELRSQVIVAHDVRMIDDHAYEWLHKKCESCSRMLAAYIRTLKQTSGRYPGIKYEKPESINA